MKDQNEQRKLSEINRPMNEELFNNLEKQYQEIAKVTKQSEGCNFCGTTLYVKTVQHTMPLLAPITRADELRHELLNLTGEIYLPIEAKFCPLCGAKMKGGAE